MTQDFAKRSKKAQQTNRARSRGGDGGRAKKRPPSNQKKAAPKPAQPPWLWLCAGIVIGLFIAFLFQLAQVKPEPSVASPQPEQPTQAAKRATAKASKPQPEFEFYTLLPESEVVVPDTPVAERKPKEPVFYYLQAASFRSHADADRLRAELILLGMDAAIESGDSKTGGTWHRVMVGPFKSRSKMSKARSTLIGKGVNPLVLKRKA